MLSFFNIALGCVSCKQEELENEVSAALMNIEQNMSGTNAYAKLSGLPWKATEEDIAKFLVDCRIVGNVLIITTESGKPSGDAVVKLQTKDDLEKALKCSGEHLDERFVVVEETGCEYYKKHTMKMEKVETEENTFIRLRGLVWSATVEDIKKFLHDCQVKKVVLKKDERGRATGDAFVQLEKEEDVDKAKTHNREYLRERFVIIEEIYESQFIKETEEVKEVKEVQGTRNKADYSLSHVMLSNLPVTSSELDIKTFLVDVTMKQVIFLKNRSGNPSGQALVEFEGKDDLVRCLICHNSTLGGRIINVDKVENNEVLKISSKKDMIPREDSDFYVKLSGLPWKATEDEIGSFLVDCKVAEVVIIYNDRGRPSGDAVVKLLKEEDLENALKCNRNYLHNRFVVVEEIDGGMYDMNAAKKRKTEKTGDSETATVCLKGLVWTATENDIRTFLHDCSVKEVVIKTNERGKPSGEAVVHLNALSDVEKAVAHNREYLGERFVIVDKM